MPVNWTSEQVIAQAPDDSSAKAGRALAAPAKWVSAGCDERAVWGECKGSGKNPYQVSIELAGPAYKCSCPSRKFPCKHALGLFLLYAAEQVAAGAPPDFCAEWLAKRGQSAERKKPAAEATPEESAKRDKAKLRRAGAREAKVAAGLGELETWIADLVRRGIAAAQAQPTAFWEQTAKRLIDAQAPNAARLVRQLSSLIHQRSRHGEKLPDKLLEQLSRLYLICEGYRRLGELPPAVAADVRAAVGFTVKEDELAAAEIVEDAWQVLGVRAFEEDRLRVQRVWLAGERSRRAALVLSFAFHNQPLDASLVAGTAIDAALAFYPGNHPQRAFVKTRGAARPLGIPAGGGDFQALLSDYSAALARNVWLEVFPALLAAVVPVRRGEDWHLRDENGETLPVDPGFGGVWKLYAICGNRPRTVFAEWDGETLRPLGVWADGRLTRL